MDKVAKGHAGHKTGPILCATGKKKQQDTETGKRNRNANGKVASPKNFHFFWLVQHSREIH